MLGIVVGFFLFAIFFFMITIMCAVFVLHDNAEAIKKLKDRLDRR